jgi:carboxymethylenebutenolidase
LGGDLTLYIAGDPIPGYLAVPVGTGPFPGVIVLHQAYGLDDDIRRQTDRVASLGYLAVAPDLVADGGWRCVAGLFRDLWRGRGEGVEKAEAVIDWVRKRADCNSKVGAIGFCLGGGFAYLLGLSGKLEATAPNYGRSPRALTGSCPVVASYGGRDRVFRRQAARVEKALDQNGIPHDVKVYPQAGHGFMNHSDGHQLLVVAGRPFLAVGYEKSAAEDAWRRIESFFARYLGR